MCYGETNLVPIDTLPQILMYARLNCQPVHVCESELPGKKGRIVCWYLKSETRYAYQKWKENRPEKIGGTLNEKRTDKNQTRPHHAGPHPDAPGADGGIFCN